VLPTAGWFDLAPTFTTVRGAPRWWDIHEKCPRVGRQSWNGYGRGTGFWTSRFHSQHLNDYDFKGSAAEICVAPLRPPLRYLPRKRFNRAGKQKRALSEKFLQILVKPSNQPPTNLQKHHRKKRFHTVRCRTSSSESPNTLSSLHIPQSRNLKCIYTPHAYSLSRPPMINHSRRATLHTCSTCNTLTDVMALFPCRPRGCISGQFRFLLAGDTTTP